MIHLCDWSFKLNCRAIRTIIESFFLFSIFSSCRNHITDAPGSRISNSLSSAWWVSNSCSRTNAIALQWFNSIPDWCQSNFIPSSWNALSRLSSSTRRFPVSTTIYALPASRSCCALSTSWRCGSLSHLTLSTTEWCSIRSRYESTSLQWSRRQRKLPKASSLQSKLLRLNQRCAHKLIYNLMLNLTSTLCLQDVMNNDDETIFTSSLTNEQWTW